MNPTSLSPRTVAAAAVAAAAVLLGACSSTPVATPAAATTPSATATASTSAGARRDAAGTGQAAPASRIASVRLPDHLDPQSAISRDHSVYFGFDDHAIDADDRAVIERHGRYLSTNPAVRVTVEGNTDERGGAEYNLALGQKRAQAVAQALKILGARDEQIDARSWGESKPRTEGGDESAWAQNRRADLRYPTN